jgi:hypothetical protein
VEQAADSFKKISSGLAYKHAKDAKPQMAEVAFQTAKLAATSSRAYALIATIDKAKQSGNKEAKADAEDALLDVRDDLNMLIECHHFLCS